MFAIRRSCVLLRSTATTATTATVFNQRQFSSGIEDRERTFENQAVRKHDAELLKKLAEHLPKPVSRVAVIGAGLMGTGIAQVTAQAGINVTLIDLNQNVLDSGMKRISDSVARVAKKQFPDAPARAESYSSDILQRIKVTSKIEDGVKDSNLVIEAIVENLKAKWELFSTVEKLAPRDAIFATNTSSLRVDAIAQAMGDHSRLGGLHFFNPVPVMKLVEVVSTSKTSESTTRTLVSFGEKIGKSVVTCRDTPGFVVNRLLVPFMAEAMRMLERGDASPQDIDTAMKLGAAHPMGPLQLADYVGLDTSKHILDGWAAEYPNEPLFRTPKILTALVDAGFLGDKSGAGFFIKGKPNPFLKEYASKK